MIQKSDCPGPVARTTFWTAPQDPDPVAPPVARTAFPTSCCCHAFHTQTVMKRSAFAGFGRGVQFNSGWRSGAVLRLVTLLVLGGLVGPPSTHASDGADEHGGWGLHEVAEHHSAPEHHHVPPGDPADPEADPGPGHVADHGTDSATDHPATDHPADHPADHPTDHDCNGCVCATAAGCTASALPPADLPTRASAPTLQNRSSWVAHRIELTQPHDIFRPPRLQI